MSSSAYAKALLRLQSLARLGVRPGLERVGSLLRKLGDPQHRYPTVHLAGTNGKGSTAAFIASCLRAAGYRTGLYSSPHLCRFSERIQIDSREIPEEAVLARLDSLLALEPGLTFFEAVTALALSHFAEQRVDIAVVETGMGGALDATNVVRPVVSVITRIDRDHLEIIGPDLSSIAREKAGIIKAGGAVSAPAVPEVEQILKGRAAEVSARLLLGGRDFRWRRDPDGLAVEAPGGTRAGLRPSLAGDHQLENAALAVVALDCVTAAGLPVPEAALRRGLAAAHWPGRLERAGEVLLDGAHNGGGARVLAAHLAIDARPHTIVLGLLGPKNPDEIIAPLRPHAERFLFTRPRSPRALDPAAELLPCSGPVPAEVCADLRAALQSARRSSAPILITGSLYLVGEARAILLGERVDPLPAVDPLGAARAP